MLILAIIIVGATAYHKAKHEKQQLRDRQWQELTERLYTFDRFYCGTDAGGLGFAAGHNFPVYCLTTEQELILSPPPLRIK